MESESISVSKKFKIMQERVVLISDKIANITCSSNIQSKSNRNKKRNRKTSMEDRKNEKKKKKKSNAKKSK